MVLLCEIMKRNIIMNSKKTLLFCAASILLCRFVIDVLILYKLRFLSEQKIKFCGIIYKKEVNYI